MKQETTNRVNPESATQRQQQNVGIIGTTILHFVSAFKPIGFYSNDAGHENLINYVNTLYIDLFSLNILYSPDLKPLRLKYIKNNFISYQPQSWLDASLLVTSLGFD